MEKEKKIVSDISRQMSSLSDFLEKVEKSMSILVKLEHLEPQLRAVMEGIKQAFDSLGPIYEESRKANLEKEEKTEQTAKELGVLREKMQKLELENEQLKRDLPKRRKKKV